MVITELTVDGENVVLGFLADSVQEVLELEPSQIDPPPRMGTRIDTSCIRGMGKREEGFVIILDIDEVLEDGALRAARGADGEGAAAPRAA